MPRTELSSQGAVSESRGKSPVRLRFALGIDAWVSTRDLSVLGQEHIERLSPGTKVIVGKSITCGKKGKLG